MIIYSGKASKMTYKELLYSICFVLAKPAGKLEPEDFSKN